MKAENIEDLITALYGADPVEIDRHKEARLFEELLRLRKQNQELGGLVHRFYSVLNECDTTLIADECAELYEQYQSFHEGNKNQQEKLKEVFKDIDQGVSLFELHGAEGKEV